MVGLGHGLNRGEEGESNLREKCSDFWLISFMEDNMGGFQSKVLTLILDVDG